MISRLASEIYFNLRSTRVQFGLVWVPIIYVHLRGRSKGCISRVPNTRVVIVFLARLKMHFAKGLKSNSPILYC